MSIYPIGVQALIDAHQWRAREPEIDRIANLLVPPWQGNHVPPTHSALMPSICAEAEQMFKVYVLSADAFMAAWALGDSKRRAKLIASHANPPHRRTCIETAYPGQTGRYLFITEGTGELFHLTLCVTDGVLFGAVFFARVSRTAATIWRPSTDYVEEEIGDAGAETMIAAVRCVWLFLTLSDVVVTSRTLTREGKRFQRKGRLTRPALLSFNRVRLNVEHFAERKSIRFLSGPGVRRHEVGGHWREVSAGAAGARVLRWIAAYLRGNERLGWVSKVREVLH